MGKAAKQPSDMFEKLQMNAEKTLQFIEQAHARKRPVCSACLQEISKKDFECGKFAFTESRASGKIYLCKNCAGIMSAKKRVEA